MWIQSALLFQRGISFSLVLSFFPLLSLASVAHGFEQFSNAGAKRFQNSFASHYKQANKPVKLVPFAEFGFQVTRDEETLQGVSATEQALEHPVSSACLLLGVPRASSFSTAALQAQRAAWRRSEFLNHGES